MDIALEEIRTASEDVLGLLSGTSQSCQNVREYYFGTERCCSPTSVTARTSRLRALIFSRFPRIAVR